MGDDDEVDMETEESIEFLLDMSNEVKHFYETPVIFLTKKDYSDQVFNTMCDIRKLIKGTYDYDKKKMMDLIIDYHLNWLHSVKEIMNFKKVMHDFPKDVVQESISYTIDAVSNRLHYYLKYMDKYRPRLSNIQQAHLQTDKEIVEEMHKHLVNVLTEKLTCFRNFHSDQEYRLKSFDAVEDLLQWLDKIHDCLSIHLSKYININVPHLTYDLTKTLQQIVDDLQISPTPSAQELMDNLKLRGRELSTMIRCTESRNLEVSKVIEKISVLDERIKRLEKEPSTAAIMALQHKKEYLEKRLASLENLRSNLKSMTASQIRIPETFDAEMDKSKYYHFKIFNHLLPAEERERLVTELCHLWDLAIIGDKSQKSIISILSAAEMKEEFSDELGTFFIDEHGRKIYKKQYSDILYQLNELNELVPLEDDMEHIYFYDDCGRYFHDPQTRQRIYKAQAAASEYMLDSSGVLLKVKEEKEGVVYHFDSYGRYYITNDDKQIYCEPDSISEYEQDGMGNLVRIRTKEDTYITCSGEPPVTEDFNYLKTVVGQALRECIAEVILHQPDDPIKHLAGSLEKYRENVEIREKRSREKGALGVEREYIRDQERETAERIALEAALLAQGGSETNFDDDMVNYNPLHDINSFTVTSGITAKIF